MNPILLTLGLSTLFLLLSLTKAQSNQSESQPVTFLDAIDESYSITTFSNETVKCKDKDLLNDTQERHELCVYNYDKEALKERIPDYPIHPIILTRRSNYEQTGESITDEELFTILEAMRWSPSNNNSQPWKIVYAHRGTPRFNEFLSILAPGNQVWNVDSAVLLVIVSDKGKEFLLDAPSFATGAAFQGMAFEASARGYLIHSMGGYDQDQLAKALGISDNKHFKIEVICAIGKRVPLSERGKKKKNDKVTLRKKMTELASRDIFKTDWIY